MRLNTKYVLTVSSIEGDLSGTPTITEIETYNQFYENDFLEIENVVIAELDGDNFLYPNLRKDGLCQITIGAFTKFYAILETDAPKELDGAMTFCVDETLGLRWVLVEADGAVWQQNKYLSNNYGAEFIIEPEKINSYCSRLLKHFGLET